MTFFDFVIIFVVGIGAGFINVLAGGGSLLTLPTLIFMGLPSALANGTNRVAIIIQNITAIASFRDSGIFHWRLGILLAIPAVIGSIIGSNFAILLSDQWFNRILSVVMVLVLITMIFKPQKKLQQAASSHMTLKKRIILFVIFFFVGVYGGFIQAGVGLVIVTLLTLFTGLNLVHSNSLKVFIVAIYLGSSLFIFIINNQVHWEYGIALAAGNSIGAIIASKFAIQKGEGFVRWVMIIAVIIMSLRLWAV